MPVDPTRTSDAREPAPTVAPTVGVTVAEPGESEPTPSRPPTPAGTNHGGLFRKRADAIGPAPLFFSVALGVFFGASIGLLVSQPIIGIVFGAMLGALYGVMRGAGQRQ